MTFRILVIEDSLTVAGILCSALEDKGISSEYAASAEEGLQCLRDNHLSGTQYDALLLAWHLPDQNGGYVVDRILSSFPNDLIPIMIYSEKMEDEAFKLCSNKNTPIDLQFKSDLAYFPERMHTFLTLHSASVKDTNLGGSPVIDVSESEVVDEVANVKILLVDDSPTHSMKYSNALKKHGYTVYQAESVKLGMSLALEVRPTIAIVDYMMPFEKGDVLVRQLLANPKTEDCMVVMLSSRSDIQEEVLKAGALNLLSKDEPINIFLLRVQAIANGAIANRVNQQLHFFEEICEQMNIGFLRRCNKIYKPANRKMASIVASCPTLFSILDEIEVKPSELDLGCDRQSVFSNDEQKYLLDLTDSDGDTKNYIYTAFTLSDKSEAILLQDNTLIVDKNRQLALANKKLQQQALYDPLTGLANRILFQAQIIKSIELAKRKNEKLAILSIDLDYFKRVNDSLGHDSGDQLLGMVSERILSTCRDSDVVSRFGGDEFSILLSTDINDGEGCAVVAGKIITAIQRPFALTLGTVTVGVSVGIAIYPDDATNIETLCKYSDEALYLAKDSGRNNYQYYTKEISEKNKRRKQLEDAMRFGLENGNFYLCYQPRVDFVSGNICGVEVLLRCKTKELGQIYPDEFIPILEETWLIFPIFEWLIDEACQQFKRWQPFMIKPALLGINISPKQFEHQGNLVDIVQRSFLKHDLPAACMDIEITESLFINNSDITLEILLALRNLGCVITLDDFGTGYASLGYIKKYPIDVLKIDRLFIKDLPQAKDDEQLVDVILGIVSTMKMGVVAEGIETVEQRDLLRGKGCHSYQGYYFSKPVEAEGIDALFPGLK